MSKLKELNNQIEKELQYCDPKETPVICSNLNDPQNKSCIVSTILEFCMTKKITISQAIAETEKTFQTNSIE